MTSMLAKKAGMKLFSQNIQQYTPVDPLYETFVDDRGRERRRKRDIPPGLSKRDVRILKKVKRRAHYLDKGFNLCGLRFGWTFFIGLIPGAGDVADAVLNYSLVLKKSKEAEIPAWLVQKMMANNLVSIGVGFVPLVGDVILAQWKANSRNAALLEEFLRIRGEEYLRLQAEGGDGVLPHVGTSADGATTKGKGKGKMNDILPGAGLASGERIVRPAKKDVIPESRIPHDERMPQTPGGTGLVLAPGALPADTVVPANGALNTNTTTSKNATTSSGGGWFKRNKSKENSSRFVEEPARR